MYYKYFIIENINNENLIDLALSIVFEFGLNIFGYGYHLLIRMVEYNFDCTNESATARGKEDKCATVPRKSKTNPTKFNSSETS